VSRHAKATIDELFTTQPALFEMADRQFSPAKNLLLSSVFVGTKHPIKYKKQARGEYDALASQAQQGN
jgi:hypothetical protein